jgi:hypothetical protein
LSSVAVLDFDLDLADSLKNEDQRHRSEELDNDAQDHEAESRLLDLQDFVWLCMGFFLIKCVHGDGKHQPAQQVDGKA